MKRIIMNEYREMDLPQGILTKESVREIFEYKDGELFYRKQFHPRMKMDRCAGSLQNNGYIAVGIGGRKYTLHKLIWVYHNGPYDKGVMDHIDRNRLNNNISNLRLVDAQINAENSIGKGWIYRKDRGTYVAKITVKKKQIILGSFKTPEEANAAYIAAKKIYHELGDGNEQ